MSKQKMKLQISDDDDVAYLYLPDHPQKRVSGIVKKQVRLLDLVNEYKGPDIYLDFSEDGILLGIEILA